MQVDTKSLCPNFALIRPFTGLNAIELQYMDVRFDVADLFFLHNRNYGSEENMSRWFTSITRFALLVMLVVGTFLPPQTAYAASLPAEINKQFTPLTIDAGGVSTLRVTIFNPNAFQLTNATWADDLIGVQPGLYIANPAGVVNTCGGTVTAVPGTTNLSLSGGTVPPQTGPNPGACYVEVNVSSVTSGNLINTIPANSLTAQGDDGGTTVNITNTTPASATITVIAVTAPSLSKGFAPNTIFVGEISRLTITLNNNDSDTNLTGTSYTDTLPSGLLLATPVNATVTGCGGSYSLTAAAGTGSIAITNATVAPGPNCVVAVDVTGASGVYTNTIPAGPGGPGSVQTNQGVTNTSPASANLNIQPMDIDKSFSPTAIQAGGITTLTITLKNPTGSAYTGVGVEDTLPGVFVIANPANVTNTCGGTLTAVPGAKLIKLAGGTIPASASPPTPVGSCVITVAVTAPSGSSASTSTNTIPANTLTADQPGVTNINSASASLSVYATGTGIGGSKSFSSGTIDPGQNSRLRIDLRAPADTDLTNFSIIDNLPLGVTVSNSTVPAVSGCGVGYVLTAATGATSISLTNGTILAGQLCRIDVYVTSSTPGTVTNTITPANISNNENRDPAGNITANLTVRTLSDLTVSKAFYPTQVIPSGISTLTIKLQNVNASPLVNVSLLDSLATMGSGGNTVQIAPTPNASTTCGGTLTAAAGTQNISLSGGTIPAQVGGVPGICTVTVNVQAQSNTNTRTNTIPLANVSGEIQGTGTTINAYANATATLQTLNLTIGVVKGFNPVLVYGGASSTLSVQLINPNNATLTGIAFTDDMTSLGAGMVIANPSNLNVGTCGGTLTGNPGDTAFSFSGGTLPPNTSCTLTLRVTMTVNGNLTNRIPAGAVTTLNGVSSLDPTQASLTNLPGVSVNKVFSPSTVLTGQASTLTITITNTSLVPVVNMGLADGLPGVLPVGLEIANPSNAANSCGGTLTATPGSQTIQLVGGGLAAAGSAGDVCAVSVDVLSTRPGVYVNTIPAGTLTADGGVTNNDPTTDTLTVDAAFSLGNRVWFDTDNSSAINGSEVGADGVTVELYAADGSGNPTGVALDTATTANGGYYRFDALPAGDYVVVIPASQFAPAGILNGYWSSGTSMNGAGTISELAAPDPDNDLDNDDNGMRQTGGAVQSGAVTLGPAANEPINDTDVDPTNPAGEAPDAQSNRTVDFGFYRQELGDLVFVDVNANGTYDAGDAPLAGATVQLFASDGTTEINVGPDGILGTADDAPGGVTTGASGAYWFSGLPQGDYIVRVTPPAGYVSTVDTANSADTTNPNTNADNNDNGVGTSLGPVSSAVVALTPGSSGALGNNAVAYLSGTTSNPTLDFGFTSSAYSLGNRVWFDTNNNKTLDGSEVGVDGVSVQLFAADGSGNPTGPALSTTTTASGGYYRFDDLAAGDYVVSIPASQFLLGAVLEGYQSSGTSIDGSGNYLEDAAPDPDNDLDNDDNGMRQTGGDVLSGAVTLGPGSDEPLNEADVPYGQGAADPRANMTVDFGFYRQELGDLVFVDVNANGTYDAGDTPLAGATVQLFASDGTTEINVGPDGILGTADDAPGGVTTGASGTYLFSGLPQGDYIVRVTPPVGYSSTIDTADSADTTDPDTNTNNNDNGIGTGVGQASSNPVTLTPGNAATNNTVDGATGSTYNPTLDFGFITNSGFAKTIINTSETFTNNDDVAIGEIVTYQISIDLPVGIALNNVTLTDQMQKGLAYVDCLSVMVAGVDMTGTICPAAVVSSITDPGDSAANPANPGRQVDFSIGNIAAQTSAATIVVQYRAIVLDVIENQAGGTLHNNVTWAWTGGSTTASAPDVRILEPELSIDKTAIPASNVTIGTPVQFTLTIAHTAQSTTDAFDVVLTDILPPTLEYIPCSITYVSGLPPTSPAPPAYCPAAATDLVLVWDSFPLGSTSTITFNARLLASPAVNSANVAWTSLPIDPAVGGLPVQLSPHNSESTERWYDPADAVNVYGVTASVTIEGKPERTGSGGNKVVLPALLPATGFAPGMQTILPEQPASSQYDATQMWIEIPSIGIKMPIVGVPLLNGDWDVSWLTNQAGWLDGTAYPTWNGNSVLTGHVFNADGKPGAFTNLNKSKWGDLIIVHANGYSYIYQIRENRVVKPYDRSPLKHEDDAWLTLLTCKNFNESTNTYENRVSVRAVLISVAKDVSSGAGKNAR